MPYTFKRIYESQRPNGFYYAEDHGADVAGVFFVGPRCRKGKYIATARVSSVESIERRIAAHTAPFVPPVPGKVYVVVGQTLDTLRDSLTVK